MDSVLLFLGFTSATIMMTGVKDKATKGSQMPTTPKAPIAGAPGGNEMIKNEMYSRISSFFGADKFRTIQDDAFVIIVGLGGVGSHAANMLIRSGVTNVRIIDFDQVTLSSLNRHAMATLADVGKSKAEVMERRIKEVAPWCKVDAVVEMFKGSEAERLLSGSPTYVLDCIDDVATKAELIAYCVKNKLQVLTSMGAGGKADPTRLRVSALSDCMNDPLASKIKWKLKKHGVSADDVMSVFSIEKPAVELLPLDEEQAAAPQDFGTVDYLRIRVMPVLGTSPAIFGQAMASKALTVLAQQEYNGEVCERMSKSLKHKLLQTCKAVEKRRYGHWDDVDLDEDDIEFAVAQVWGSRCVVTSKRFGGHAPLMLVRWNSMKPPAVDNLVLLSKNNAEKVEADTQDHAKPVCFEPEVTARIEERLAWAKAVVGGSSSNMRGVASPAAMLLSGLSKTWSLLHVAALVAASASLGYGAAKAGALDR